MKVYRGNINKIMRFLVVLQYHGILPKKYTVEQMDASCLWIYKNDFIFTKFKSRITISEDNTIWVYDEDLFQLLKTVLERVEKEFNIEFKVYFK